MEEATARLPLAERVEAAAAVIRTRLAEQPGVAQPLLALVLGSGLGAVVELLDAAPRVEVPYREIPHVPASGVAGHAGTLVAGRVVGRPVLVLAGRAHTYEGHTQAEVTLLLRAVFRVGVSVVVLTNAAGGLNPAFEPGELMLISDHINLSGANPLTGPNLDLLGPRFPALTDAYDPDLASAATTAAHEAGVVLHEGVYVMLAGPSFETRAELRMLRALGADAVGLSTVPEVIVARHAGIRVLGISLITNKATPDVEVGASHEEVLEMGRIGAERLVALFTVLLPRIA